MRAAASSASPDDTSTVACQPQPGSRKRTPWGSAVPRVSMPTSQASAEPAWVGTQLTTSFMPSG